MNTKRFLQIIVGFLLLMGGVMVVHAIAPTVINYQGRLRQSGQPVSGDYAMTFGLFTTATGGSSVWSESATVAVSSGIFTHRIGSVSSLSGINWSNGPYWIEVAVAGNTLTPREELSAVIYAFESGKLSGQTYDAFVSTSGAQMVAGAKTFTNQVTITSGTTITGDLRIGVINPATVDSLMVEGGIRARSHATDTYEVGYSMVRNGVSVGYIDNNAGNFRIKAQNNASVEVVDDINNMGLCVADGGAVGIGTAAPSGKFHVSGGSITVTGGTIRVADMDVGTGTVVSIDGNGYLVKNTSLPDAGQSIAVLTATQTFSGLNTFTNQVTITSGTLISGNLAIGVTAFTTVDSLMVEGGIRAGSHVTDTYEVGFSMLRNGVSAGYIDNNAGNFRIKAQNNASMQVVDDSNNMGLCVVDGGAVGVGTATPSGKFHVSGGSITVTGGTVRASDMGTGAGTAVQIDADGYLVKNASSIRYKTNIQPLVDDFAQILHAQPVSFTYKSNSAEDIGYIVEEFEKLGLQHLIVYNKEGKPDALKYDKISVYLLELVKTHNNAIGDLHKENEQLKARLKAIEDTLSE